MDRKIWQRRKKREERKKSITPGPVRITDTTLRDAHQSLWATRLRTSDIIEIIETIDAVGYYSLEVWGGATFDVCLRYLREDPWERLRAIKARVKKTPLQMLLRGQNILGYKNYPDDLLDRFVALAREGGIDIFRIFDALNDTRNMEFAIRAVKKYGGHAQGTLCYTISPVHTVEEYLRVAKELVQIGIDSLCIKDMAGILSPASAEQLVSALITNLDVPVQVHSHATSGMVVATYLEAVKAGAGAIDCAISPLSGFSSQPAVETILTIFEDTPYKVSLNKDALKKIREYFLELTPKRRPKHHPNNIIDPDVLEHHVPGGMISNLRSQLAEQNALNRLNEVLEELPRTRAELGYPPLVTPTSQIVGVQAVLNVLSGERYGMVPQETKNYVKGLYGRPPRRIEYHIRKKILGNESVIDCRPADLLEPVLPKATHDVPPEFIKSEEDIISYCLFPEPALEYFKWRNLPPDQRPPSPADKETEESIDENTTTNVRNIVSSMPFLTPDDYRELHLILEKLNQLGISELSIRKQDAHLTLESSGMIAQTQVETKAAVSTQSETDTKRAEEKQISEKITSSETQTSTEKQDIPAGAIPIEAPLNGTFYVCSAPGKPPFVKVGDKVKAGSTVCTLEAMKLFNEIKAPVDCEIVKILAEHGKTIQKGQPLLLILPL